MANRKWKSLCFFGFVTLAPGCGAAGPSSDYDHEVEAEASGVETLSEELRGSVDCRERVETAYTSGRPSSIRVITIAGKSVSKPTGHAFLRLQRAASEEARITIGLTSGFRTMSEQQYLYDCYLTKTCNDGNRAAKPGYSNHQSGSAVDVTTSAWLAENAGRFGFVRTVPDEPWHYEYYGSDPGGPCSTTGDDTGSYPVALRWESPKEDGWYKNGIWFKLDDPDPRLKRVVYWAGSYRLGESTDAAGQFALRYTFNVFGDRSVTAMGYDASDKQIAQSTVNFRVVE